jgi:eukaryotic-like serine/threonine-protein kinase
MHGRLVAGRYRLVRELSRGGMGTVWLAEDQVAGHQVAVEELRPPHGLAPADRVTYDQRALQQACSRHPGAATLDVVPASAGDDAVYLVMELPAAGPPPVPHPAPPASWGQGAAIGSPPPGPVLLPPPGPVLLPPPGPVLLPPPGPASRAAAATSPSAAACSPPRSCWQSAWASP